MPNVAQFQTRAMTLGRSAHKVIQRVLAEGLAADALGRTAQLLDASREVLAGEPLGRRERAGLIEVASAAASYFKHFPLAPGWRFQQAEVSLLRDGRVDVVFRETNLNLWLVDELKMGFGRSLDAAIRPQIERYVHAGTEKWGDCFMGVRSPGCAPR